MRRGIAKPQAAILLSRKTIFLLCRIRPKTRWVASAEVARFVSAVRVRNQQSAMVSLRVLCVSAVSPRYNPLMPKPQPKPIEESELVELALAVVRADRFPHLATADGDQPRVRPVSPVRTDGFTVYVANLRAYHKTGNTSAASTTRNSSSTALPQTASASCGSGRWTITRFRFDA
jgi:hypothetical protein